MYKTMFRMLVLLNTSVFFSGLFAQNSRWIDINYMRHFGVIQNISAPEFDIGGLKNIFDRKENKLARTASINPAYITIEFNAKFHFDRSRLLMSSGNGKWTLETADSLSDLENKIGSYQLVFSERPTQMDLWDEALFTTSGRIIRLIAERTTGDDYVHLHEWELYGYFDPFQSIKPDSLQLYEGWRWKHKRNSETIYTSSDPTIASVDESGVFYANNAGETIITQKYFELQTSTHILVLESVLKPVYEKIDTFLATPAAGFLYEIPVVIMRYLPTRDGVNLDVSYAPDHWLLGEITLEDMKSWIKHRAKLIKFGLEERSRYHGYKDSLAVPTLGYRVVEYITVYTQTPPGEVHDIEGEDVCWPDYHLIFEHFNMEHYVNDLGVKEVWLWVNQLVPGLPSYDPTIHRPESFRGIWESNMSSPTTDDISNSDRDNTDLPVYKSTYVVVDRNMRRTAPIALHAHGHQLEAQLSHVLLHQDGNTDLLWKQFVGKDDFGHQTTGRCGCTHMPPNTTQDYDYLNPNLVESDIEDWTPDRSGNTTWVNADTWGSLNYAYPENITNYGERAEFNWYIYWGQNMPGFGNTIQYNGNYMTNWWLITADWDKAIDSEIGLYAAEPVSIFELTIETTQLSGAIYLNHYSDFVVADGGVPPYFWSVISGQLPPGITLNDSTGEISGLPSGSGDFIFEVMVQESSPISIADTSNLLISVSNSKPYFISSDSITVLAGEKLFYTARALDAENNSLYFTFTNYPMWLSPEDSTITGSVPESAADTSFIVIVTDGELSDTIKVVVELDVPSSVFSTDLIPIEFLLAQNYPNPFNPETEIRFQIPKASKVSLIIYNLLGQEIRTLGEKAYTPGEYSILWDGRDDFGKPVASGIYLYQLNAGKFSQVCKMALLK